VSSNAGFPKLSPGPPKSFLYNVYNPHFYIRIKNILIVSARKAANVSNAKVASRLRIVTVNFPAWYNVK
jgi:hypothetical protein